VTGRVVLVTGGNRGIGLAVAKSFAAAGHRVAITSRGDASADIADAGILAVRCDVTDSASVDSAFSQIEQQLGPVEILVSNAGVTRDMLVLRMSEDDFTSVIDANLTGAWRVAKLAAAGMLRQRKGRIVFVSSVGAYYGSPGQANYAASKAGLIGMARSMARELASRAITVNVVCPGGVETDMTASLTDAQRDAMTNAVPLGRLATPQEIASAVTFLASPESSYITGVVLPVDGGLAMGH
jgi:3-oxoacyl-[acyl-carrier protein] reductase